MSRSRKVLVAAAVAALAPPIVFGATSTSASTVPLPPSTEYTVSVGSVNQYHHPTDTPAFPYIDKDGTFYFQQSAALYGENDPRYWDFFTGANFDNYQRSSAISDAVNPDNPDDRNNDTTWRCNNSPTGLESTDPPAGSGYSQKNYCDLIGTWVDPDTGNWYGLVHNEFTPEPFGPYNFSHYDAIDVAVSTNQGKVWTITGHAITSPYSTERNDTTAFPEDSFHYGDGDPRLFVDAASGYFYVYFTSRIVPKQGVSGGAVSHGHVARAPMSSKMGSGSWRKWYNGAWNEPGIGGKESNMVPIDSSSTTGYTPPEKEYDPTNPGSPDAQVAAGTLPPLSPLLTMNITYDAYLGLYVGEPEVKDQSNPSAQLLYVTDDLSTQKWHLIGNTGTYKSGSWYRWIVDSVSRTGTSIVGKTFRSYCAHFCSKHTGEYVNITVNSTSPAAPPVDLAKAYTIGSGNGRVLAQTSGSSATTSDASVTGSALQAWTFASNGDGSYRITNNATGHALGVDSGTSGGRAWGAKPTVTPLNQGSPTVGQQWFVVPDTSSSGTPSGAYRLVNRYSGLVLGMSSDSSRLTETTPVRTWTNSTGSTVGGNRTGAEQKLTFTATSAGAPAGATGPIVGLAGKCVDVQSASTSDGTPIQLYTCNGTAAQNWTIAPDGSIRALGKCMDITNGFTANRTKIQLYTCNGTGAQNWQVRTDGSLYNARSGRCLDVTDGISTNGTQLQIYTCNGTAAQKWRVPAGPITGVGAACVDVAAADDGTPVQLKDCNGTAAQTWTVPGDGTLRALGKCMDITNGYTANGTKIQLYACNGSGAQNWQARTDGTLYNPLSGRCLDAPGVGMQLQISDCNTTANQKWKLS